MLPGTSAVRIGRRLLGRQARVQQDCGLLLDQWRAAVSWVVVVLLRLLNGLMVGCSSGPSGWSLDAAGAGVVGSGVVGGAALHFDGAEQGDVAGEGGGGKLLLQHGGRDRDRLHGMGWDGMGWRTQAKGSGTSELARERGTERWRERAKKRSSLEIKMD